ncbi:MAG: hypothetical protein K2X86_12900 [Cytophagaceae bacterium]|nr:hypothetical protein [Cytophagaceae bacterium]
MKKILLTKHFFLFISLGFFFLVFTARYFFIEQGEKKQDKEPVQKITSKINQELKVLDEECEEVRQIILTSEKPTFSKLLKPSVYPYFVYRNKNLYFWSDNTIAPSYESLKGTYDFKYVDLNNGKYIVHSDFVRTRGDVFEIFIFLPLSKEYSIQNDYISSGLNKVIFGDVPFKITTAQITGAEIISSKGVFLFAVEFPKDHLYKNENVMLVVCLSLAGIVCLILYLGRFVLYLKERKRTDLSIATLFFGLIIIRGGMLFFGFPFSLHDFDLFNSKYFASSYISPSLGDVLFNIIVLLLFSWYLFNNYCNSILFIKLIKTNKRVKAFISVFLILFSFLALFAVFNLVGALSYHSQWSLDITYDLNYNLFRIISVLILILAFVVYFLFTHIFFRLFILLNASSDFSLILQFLAGAVLYALISYFLWDFNWVLLVINAFYFFILYTLRLPKTLGRLRYTTYIYYLSCAFICSIVAAYSIYEENYNRTVFLKKHFATDLLFKNDIFGEFLLNEASMKIKKDAFIQNKLVTPFSSVGVIEHKIKRVFLSKYFDKYNVIVSLFDATGEVYEKKSDYSSFQEAQEKYQKENYKTDYNDVYFFSDPESGFSKYISLNKVVIGDVIVGYIVIELQNKKTTPHSLYPELFVDTKTDKHVQSALYDYAVFSGGKLAYSFGSFNYKKNFPLNSFMDEDLFEDGIIREGFHHVGVKGADDKIIIISSEKYSFRRVFSNFSFFFLKLIVLTLFFISIYAVYFRFRKINVNYATKIQIYLNIAFFLPLLIVSITTLSIITVSYSDNLNDSFIKKAENISSNVIGYFQDNKVVDSEKEKVENVFMQISEYTQTDINLFNSKGRLIFSNQSMIYDLGFLSRLMNANAYAILVENANNTLMMSESIGNLNYNVVYVAIRSVENGELLGILSIPFFESKNELNKQIIEVLTTIVNIFITIFILFVVLSYFASHILTYPLQIITQKLKKTTLEKNEPIEWNSGDEIGLLVGEYNRMLVKLEESKEALAKSEKESAWREMAKQVAHEIKNPLTPMKLTIQHLQRAIDEGKAKDPEITNKSLNVLLDQVNNLNEIATSFSLFAKMPIPKTQRFEISSVLAKTAALHNNDKDVDVETDIPAGEYFVLGDEQLMSSIFTNLILNGKQSVPNDRRAKINVSLEVINSRVLIEIRDNGTGIPRQIRDKVFLPNFSTKFAGSGIGLAVAKRGVEHAGGKIWFETEEGTGTSFFIEIPLID